MILLVLSIGSAVYVLVKTGQFATIEPKFTGHCVALNGMAGPEDILIHPSGDFAFISSDNRRASMAGNDVPGAIYFYDLKNQNADPVNLTKGLNFDFHPLGISFFSEEDGSGTLFVVNRRSLSPVAVGTNNVVIFRWENQTLRYVKAVEVANSPNDIAAVGADQFYVTNDYEKRDGLLADLQTIVPLPLSSVGFYDGGSYREVISGLAFANGIAVSKTGDKIYVAETLGQKLSVYAVNAETHNLKRIDEIELDSAPDNISISADNQIWIAAHPQLLSLYGHRGDSGKLAPSQILRLTRGVANQFVVEQVLLDAGDLMSGASVAAAIGERVLIGAAFENKFLDCSL